MRKVSGKFFLQAKFQQAIENSSEPSLRNKGLKEPEGQKNFLSTEVSGRNSSETSTIDGKFYGLFFSAIRSASKRLSGKKPLFFFWKIFTTFPENIIYPRSEIFSNPRKETKNDKKTNTPKNEKTKTKTKQKTKNIEKNNKKGRRRNGTHPNFFLVNRVEIIHIVDLMS